MQIVNRVRLYRRRHGTPGSWCYFGLTVASEISWLLRGQGKSGYAVMALLCLHGGHPRSDAVTISCPGKRSRRTWQRRQQVHTAEHAGTFLLPGKVSG